jgi:hypothetical protein
MGGAKSMTGSQLGANLGTGPVNVSSYLGNSAAPSMIDPSMVDPSGMDYTGMWNNVNNAGQYIGTNPDLVGQGGGMFESMMSMPSKDTLTKGLLGSMVFKNVMPSRGQKQQPQARAMPLARSQMTGMPRRQSTGFVPQRNYQQRRRFG